MSRVDKPIIDVLIPAYNSAETIVSSLKSIQQQTVSDIRIIIIDDGSTDATPDLVAAVAAKDSRIEYIKKPNNSGIVDALNLGLARSCAPYIARHDADDLAYPERFAVQLQYLEAHSDCLAIGAVARHVDVNGRHTGGYATPRPIETADPCWFPAREPYLMHPFLMLRREAAISVGGYRHVFHAEDADLYWRLQERGRLYNPPDVLGDYRFHAGSITSKSLHNGRVSALNSQLAAISAVRRRSGQPDLIFNSERLREYEMANTTEDLLRLVEGDLTSKEYLYLRSAVAAKLIETASYRPYVLDESDCKFIKRSLQTCRHQLNSENAVELRNISITVGTKMFYHKRIRELTSLLSFADLTKTFLRVARISMQARLRRLKLTPR